MSCRVFTVVMQFQVESRDCGSKTKMSNANFRKAMQLCWPDLDDTDFKVKGSGFLAVDSKSGYIGRAVV